MKVEILLRDQIITYSFFSLTPKSKRIQKAHPQQHTAVCHEGINKNAFFDHLA